MKLTKKQKELLLNYYENCDPRDIINNIYVELAVWNIKPYDESEMALDIFNFLYKYDKKQHKRHYDEEDYKNYIENNFID